MLLRSSMLSCGRCGSAQQHSMHLLQQGRSLHALPPLRPAPAPRLSAVCVVAGKAKKQRQQRRDGGGGRGSGGEATVSGARPQLLPRVNGGMDAAPGFREPSVHGFSNRPNQSLPPELVLLQQLGGGLGPLANPFASFAHSFSDAFVDPFEELQKQRMISKCLQKDISPLHLAAGAGMQEDVRRMLQQWGFLPAAATEWEAEWGDYGSDRDGEGDDDGSNEFMHPDAQDFEGRTPLHWACSNVLRRHAKEAPPAPDKKRVVEWLLQAGAHADTVTHDGHTPSMYIVESAKGAEAVGCLALLQRYGADLHVLDEQGRSLLMRAAAAGNVEAARWLLEQGLDPALVDKQGRRVEHHAQRKVRKQINAAAASIVEMSSAGAAATAATPAKLGCGDALAAGPPQLLLPQRSRRLQLPPEGCPELEPRQLVWGKMLGSGSYAVVHAGSYRAQPVAIKVPKLHTEEYAINFIAQQQELQALARLAAAATAVEADCCGGSMSGAGGASHVLDFKGVVTRRDGAQALVLGRCVTALSDEAALAKLTAADRFRVARELAQGLAFMHEHGVVHKDLKIDNVLLDSTGGVKICDFGLSAIASPATNKGAGVGWAPLQDESFGGDQGGNPFWSAPELVNCWPYSGKADVWTWGIMLSQLAGWRGATPFPSMDSSTVYIVRTSPQRLGPEHLRRHILRHTRTDSTDVRQLVSDCVQADPAARPSMSEVVQRLEGMAVQALPRPERGGV